MTNTNDIRQFMKLMEASYTGPHTDNPDITYSAEEKKGEITKVIAVLKSDTSGKYTKLGRNLNRMMELRAEADKLEEEAKATSREMIADLFHASDACRTREVDTVSFLFKITKDPEASTTVKYAKVLEELQAHLTPELIVVLEGLKAQYSSVTTKSPSLLKHVDKEKEAAAAAAKAAGAQTESINEGIWDSLKARFSKFAAKVMNWGKKYDAKLDALKAEAGISESIEEGVGAKGPIDNLIDQLVEAVMHLGMAKGGEFADSVIQDYQEKVNLAKAKVLSVIQR